LLVRPAVRAVVADVDGLVADESDAARDRVAAHRLPLPREQPLREVVVADLLFEPGARRLQRGRAPARERLVPLHPRPAAVRLAQGAEQGMIGEPRGLADAERVEVLAVLARGAARE